MGASIGGDDDDAIVAINITPFVDIILVVLIIFMVTATTIVKKSIKVELPEAATGESTETTPLAIELAPGGGMTLQGEPTTFEALRAAVRAAQAESATTKVPVVAMIGADKTVPHGDVVKVMDLVRQEGVARFALNIDPAPMPAEAPAPPTAPAGAPAAP
ncbi:MAG: hypothetical protein RL071_2956 [Pseudomonadota bacterium]|jgi:biopolymer transport protein ExbD